MTEQEEPKEGWAFRNRLHEIIFEADTPEGRAFDIAVFGAIGLSVIVVMLDTVPALHRKYGVLLYAIEWALTIFFTIEYGLRLYCVYKPKKYATSFFGIIDLLAIIPTYLSLFWVGTQALLVLRALRLMRLFRVFKLGQYSRSGRVILIALRRSVPKLVMFITFVMIMVIIFGSIMFLIEGQYNEQFDSIPRAVYWAVVTITTVGYGDISPHTVVGQIMASIMMLIGYAVIAVPLGVFSAELIGIRNNTASCRYCGFSAHDDDAVFCKRCGAHMHAEDEQAAKKP